MENAALFFIMISGLFIIPGCGRLVDWGCHTFNQGSDLAKLTDFPASYVRSVTVCDHASTSAKFSALPLLDEALEFYACMYARRMGMNADEQQEFLEQWKCDNVSGLTFYVVSLHEHPLGQPNSVWGVFAEVDGKTFRPTCIQKTELPPEFRAFFGKECTIFREAHRVTFVTDSSIIDTVSIKLFFRSITKQALLCWNTLDDDEDCDRCRSPWC